MPESADIFNDENESEMNRNEVGKGNTVCWCAVATSIFATGCFVGFLIVSLLYLTLQTELVDCGIPNTGKDRKSVV